jgi:hypothetical protein
MTSRHTDDDFGLTLLMQSFHQDWTNIGSGTDVLNETLWVTTQVVAGSQG